MLIRWLLAAVHLLALGIGLGAVVSRASALRHEAPRGELKRVFASDSAWGLAAFLWISTGLLRAFAGFEKGSAFYLGNTWFLTKMGLLLLILALEVRPMVTLVRWRITARRGTPPDTSSAATLARISSVQAALVVAMVLAASAMARGFG